MNLTVAIVSLVCCMLPAVLWAQESRLSDKSVLMRAFDMGTSLVVAEVVGKEPSKDDLPRFKLNIRRLIVPGDLSAQEVKEPISTSCSWAYADKLIVGHTYALFIMKEPVRFFSWAFRDDYYELDTANKKEMRRLDRLAKRAYRDSKVYRFRRAKPDEDGPLPNLDAQLLVACEQFKENPGNRADQGREIWKSDLGSRVTPRPAYSSVITYDPPSTRLSRGQIIRLLGQPTLKSGFTYYWHCGDEANPVIEILHGSKRVFDEGERFFGLLTVTFDAEEKVRFLRYTAARKISDSG